MLFFLLAQSLQCNRQTPICRLFFHTQSGYLMSEALQLSTEDHTRLRQTLLSCDDFQDMDKLRAIFAVAELKPWYANLPEANSQAARVDCTINYLRDKSHINGTPALILLLRYLGDRYDPNDARQKEFLALAEYLEQSLQSEHSSQVENDRQTLAPLSVALQAILDKLVLLFYNSPQRSADKQYLQAQFVILAATPEHELHVAQELLCLVEADQARGCENIDIAVGMSPVHAIEQYLRHISGALTMSMSAPPVNYAASVFSLTAKSIMRELSSLEQYRIEWPELMVGDEVKDKSLASLQRLHNQMKAIRNLLHRFSSSDNSLLQQDTYEGFINSISDLADLLEEVDSHISFSGVSERIVDDMERLYDDLVYYSYECFLWLNRLAQTAQRDNQMDY